MLCVTGSNIRQRFLFEMQSQLVLLQISEHSSRCSCPQPSHRLALCQTLISTQVTSALVETKAVTDGLQHNVEHFWIVKKIYFGFFLL